MNTRVTSIDNVPVRTKFKFLLQRLTWIESKKKMSV